LNSQLAKTEVRAPFDGTIDDVITDQGNVVAAGMTPLIRIVNLNEMYIETNVPEAYLSSVVPGKTVYVDFPILNKTITASVRQAGNFINAANRTFKIEINIPNMDQLIKPNLTAKLRINDYSNESAFLIPQSIISENADGKQYVYIVQNTNSSNFGVTKRVIITTGKNYQDQVEVLNGLKSNMLLIEEGARSVKEGQEVEIINQ
jgi:membrane fusion protein, multidrug efflux system